MPISLFLMINIPVDTAGNLFGSLMCPLSLGRAPSEAMLESTGCLVKDRGGVCRSHWVAPQGRAIRQSLGTFQ